MKKKSLGVRQNHLKKMKEGMTEKLQNQIEIWKSSALFWKGECSEQYKDGLATGGLLVGLVLGGIWAYVTFFK